MKIITHSGPFNADVLFATAIAVEYCKGVKDSPHWMAYRPEIKRPLDHQTIKEGLRDVFTIAINVGDHNPKLRNFNHHCAVAGLVAQEILPAESVLLQELCRNVAQPEWAVGETIHKCNPLNGEGETDRFDYLVKLAGMCVESILFGEDVSEATRLFGDNIQVKAWVKEYDEAPIAPLSL